MGDAEDALPPSKKRVAGRELNRDKLDLDDEEDTVELETGTFKRASEEVLATRRIVKVRRNTTAAAPQPSKNPFAGIRLVPPSDLGPTKEGQATASESEGTELSESTAKNLEPEAVADKDLKDAEKTEVSETQESHVGPVAKNVEEDKENEQKESGSKEAEAEFPAEKVEEGKENEQNESESKGAEAEFAGENVEVGNETQQVESETKEAEAEPSAQEDATNKNGNGDLKEAAKPEADDENAESEVQKDEENTVSAGGTSLSSFQQLSSNKNAFTGLAGTGFASSTFSFGSIPKDGSASLLGSKSGEPSLNFGLDGNGNSSVFGSSGSPIIPKAEESRFPSKEEVVVETGEENERVVFLADSVLFEFIDGNWKERGKGEIKVNVSTTGAEKARLIMRTKGNLRLVMNASLYPEIKLANMDKKGITFACVNSISEGKNGLSTFALKFRDGTTVASFQEAVEAHKGKVHEALQTSETSVKALEE